VQSRSGRPVEAIEEYGRERSFSGQSSVIIADIKA
jgi:hypothetical protein